MYLCVFLNISYFKLVIFKISRYPALKLKRQHILSSHSPIWEPYSWNIPTGTNGHTKKAWVKETKSSSAVLQDHNVFADRLKRSLKLQIFA